MAFLKSLVALLSLVLFQEHGGESVGLSPSLDDQGDPRCLHNLSIMEVGETVQDHTLVSCCDQLSVGNDTEMTPSAWHCLNLQLALLTASRIGFNISSQSGNSSGRCVTISVPPGEHYLTEPVEFGDTSIHLRGHGEVPGSGDDPCLPVIHCNYTIAVDIERLFDLSYSYVNYTMNFHRSMFFIMEGLEVRSCAYPFRMEAIEHVRITNSIFEYFSEAVFDIFNVPDTSITNSKFINNFGTGISRVSFRGNGGAVAIGFNNIETDISPPHVMVERCNFTNNRATARNFFQTTTNSFFNKIFTGRGGGLAIFINESSHNITGMIADNVFVNNYARSFGGGLFMLIFGEGTQIVLLVERNMFQRNVGELGAGALLNTYISNSLPGAPHMTNITDCSFHENSGESGGAVLNYLSYQGDGSSFLKLERCNFSRNTGVGSMDDFGSAYAVWLVDNLRNRGNIPPTQIVDCIFEENSGTNGIVGVGYAPFSFHGKNIFRQNTGTSSLRVIGSLVEFYGYIEFSDNRVGDYTALEMLSFAQIRIHEGLQLLFTGNKGEYGASVFSSIPISASTTFVELSFNPQCFILYEDPVVPPSQWNNVSVIFRKNEAILASSLYIGSLDSCSWFSSNYPFFDQLNILKWPLWDLGNDSKNNGYENVYDTKYHVETTAEIIDTTPNEVMAWPGLMFIITLNGWDEFRNPTTVGARFTFKPNRNNEDIVVVFDPEAIIVDSSGSNATLVTKFPVKYTISSGEALQINGSIGTVEVNPLFENSRVIGDRFMLYADLCPGGYELTPSENGFECSCKNQVLEVLDCEEDQDRIIIESGYWVTTIPSTSLLRHVMRFYTCPAGYCRCSQSSSFGGDICVFIYTNSNPDAQCDCNRHGILCGECREGHGVSALLNECVSCNNASGILILLLIVIDIVVFIFIILADRRLPGIFYAFTFSIQIAPLASLNFPASFIVVGKYLYYVSSFFSFYFPYDFCLYGNMSPLVSYFIRLLPFCLAVLVISTIVVLRKLILKKRWKWKLRYRGISSIILLLYTPTVYTALSILHCPYLTLNSGSSLRWSVSGSVVCFSDGHIPLSLLAIAVLSISVGLIPLAVFISLGKLPRRLHRLKKLQLSLTENFKDTFKWWSAVELGRRFIFALFIVIVPQEQVALLLLLCVVLVLYGYVQPYKTLTANLLEILLEMNFLILLLLVSSRILYPLDVMPPPMPIIQGGSNSTDTSCDVQGRGIVQSTWFLAPFYYFPLGLLIGICIFHSIRLIYRHHKSTKAAEVDLDHELSLSGSIPYSHYSGATTTQILELREFQTSDNLTNYSLRLSS